VLKQDLRDMPIDHGDMFLMSQTEDLIDASEVAEIMPWEAEETERRLAALVELGLLEWVDEQGVPVDRVVRDTTPNFYVAVTLRPKAPEPVADLFRQTETSVVALRALDGLLLFDQAVIHNDRSVFSRATVVKEEPRSLDGPVFATARPRAPNPDEPVHFSLPPLSGVMASVAAKTAPSKANSRPEPEPPPELISFSLPPVFPGDDVVENVASSGFDLPRREESGFISLPPFPGDEVHEAALLSRATQMHERRAPPIRFKQPVFVGERSPQPAPMTRATRVATHEPSVFSRATVPGELEAEPSVMSRGTLVYEKKPAPSVYERTTVVDEDAEERAKLEKASTLRQGGTKRR